MTFNFIISSLDTFYVQQEDQLVHIAAETGEQEEAGTIGEDEEIATDDTMVLYVNIHEPDPTARHQLIECYRSMFIVH